MEAAHAPAPSVIGWRQIGQWWRICGVWWWPLLQLVIPGYVSCSQFMCASSVCSRVLVIPYHSQHTNGTPFKNPTCLSRCALSLVGALGLRAAACASALTAASSRPSSSTICVEVGRSSGLNAVHLVGGVRVKANHCGVPQRVTWRNSTASPAAPGYLCRS